MQSVLNIIGEDMVAERHYFLKGLQAPFTLWGIRGICVLAALVAIMAYIKMRRRNGE